MDTDGYVFETKNLKPYQHTHTHTHTASVICSTDRGERVKEETKKYKSTRKSNIITVFQQNRRRPRADGVGIWMMNLHQNHQPS